MKICVFGEDMTLKPISFHSWGIRFSLAGMEFKVNGHGGVMWKEARLEFISDRVLFELAKKWVGV